MSRKFIRNISIAVLAKLPWLCAVGKPTFLESILLLKKSSAPTGQAHWGRITLQEVLAGVFLFLFMITVNAASELSFSQKTASWQQVDKPSSFTVFSDRDIYSTLDKDGRIVIAIQIGKNPIANLADVKVAWTIKDENGVVKAASSASLSNGMVYIDFELSGFVPGKYEVTAIFKTDVERLADISTAFVVQKESAPVRSGSISVYFPTGVSIKEGSYPIACGIPFPKHVLYSPENVQLYDAAGKIIPCQTIVRSRWGNTDESSIRWLGLDFQTSFQDARDGKDMQAPYILKFGSDVKRAKIDAPIKINESVIDYVVDTGKAQFTIKKTGFNLFDKVNLDGKDIINSSVDSGLYLTDQNGITYRSSNDKKSKAIIEEAGPLRSVIRVDGWYVKDGSNGELQSYTLPTDKLCKFVTRLEFYAGKSYVRVLSTWIITFDIFSVRLKDLGISIPLSNINSAKFAIKDAEPFECSINGSGAYFLQHLHNKFLIKSGGKQVKMGTRSGGWFSVGNGTNVVTASLNETWQRYPKEFEVLPDMMKLHVWPAHGVKHPAINQLTHQNLTRIIYAHEGWEMNLPLPWDYYLTSAKLLDSDAGGVYTATGQLLAGVHAGAMGAAITSDILVDFSSISNVPATVAAAECFQKKPHALADPEWNCSTLAAGYLHPYDPDKFPLMEKIIKNSLHGYEKVNDVTQEYGMWIYRRWHHSDYLGDKKWNLYRFNNTTHHHEALMPWLFYLRSGDPFYLRMGEAHLRSMADVGIIHYENDKYPAKEFHSQQKALLGSTKHTNGFVPWGADHAVAGHLTSYDALMWAYYLTGDLRYREVVVGEWQKTITEKRDDPEYNKADRSIRPDDTIVAGQKTGARDVDCFVGELLELYKLTQNPKVLVVLAPRLKVMENNPITDWGMPLHNIILYYGSLKLRADIKEFSKDFLEAGAVPENNPHMFWSYGYRQHEVITMASIVDNFNKDYALAAYYCAEPWAKNAWSEGIKNLLPNAVMFYSIPDVILKYPHLMYAIANSGCDTSKTIAMKQPMPIGDIKNKGWSRIFIKENIDREIKLTISGRSSIDIPIVVRSPNGTNIITSMISAKLSDRKSVVIPKDGKTGIYSIFIHGRDTKTELNVPISDLPEVYCPEYWVQIRRSRFFMNYPDDWNKTFTLISHKSPGMITARDGREVLARTKSGEIMTVEVPSDGIWLEAKARYVSVSPVAIMSITPERWFALPEELISQPLPILPKHKK